MVLIAKTNLLTIITFQHKNRSILHMRVKVMDQFFLLTAAYYATHYENTPMIFHCCKNENFHMKKCDIFLMFAQNIDCGYTLEPPH